MENYELLKLISVINHQIQSQLLKPLNPMGFTYSEGKSLYYLSMHEGINQDELATLMQINKTAVTHLLKSLEDKKCIERYPSLQDGRVKKVVPNNERKRTMRNFS